MSVAGLRRRISRVEDDLPQLLEPGLDREEAEKLAHDLDVAIFARERIEQDPDRIRDPFRPVEEKYDPPRFNSGGFEGDILRFVLNLDRHPVFYARMARKRGVDLESLTRFAGPFTDRQLMGYGWRAVSWLAQWETTPEPADRMLPPRVLWQWYVAGEHHLAEKEEPNYDRNALHKELDDDKAGFFAAAEAVGWVDKVKDDESDSE